MEQKSLNILLSVSELTAGYGEIIAFRDVSLCVKQGEMVTLIGGNGAGKTSLLRTIAGVLKRKQGEVSFDGKEIHGLQPFKIVRRGMSWVQEGRGIFKRVSVEENIKVGGYHRKRHEVTDDIQWIYSKFPILGHRRTQFAGTLSGGEQQMLAIARALMARPKLILLDEPSLGLAPLIVRDIYDIIVGLKKERITMLLVEQNARIALATVDRGYLMETGRIVLEGTASELRDNSKVKEAYLGGRN